MKKNALLFILLIFITNLSIGQISGIKMKSFVPKSKKFDIYYPENFTIQEDEENIVTIFDKNNEINITISSYTSDKDFDATSIVDLINNYFKNYFSIQLKKSDFKEYRTSFDNLIESEFKEKDNYWMWWSISKKNTIILISLNKTEKITEANVNLLRFMINKLIIY